MKPMRFGSQRCLGEELSTQEVRETLLLNTELSKDDVEKIVSDLERIKKGEKPLFGKFVIKEGE